VPQGGFSNCSDKAGAVKLRSTAEHTMRPRQSLHVLRGIASVALIGTTLALGGLRDALVYAPNGAEVDYGATASTTREK